MLYKEIKMLFDSGVLSYCVAVPSNGGYCLGFYYCSLNELAMLNSQRGDLRIFKTADAVIKIAKQIGFNEVAFKQLDL